MYILSLFLNGGIDVLLLGVINDFKVDNQSLEEIEFDVHHGNISVQK